jgi:hypothetical protein
MNINKYKYMILILWTLIKTKRGRRLLIDVSKGNQNEDFAIIWAENWIRENKKILDRFD